MSQFRACLLSALIGLSFLARSESADLPPEYIGDHPERVLSSQQAWGELGWNTAAHQNGVSGAPLVIGNKSYLKGLGHHAGGSITLLLDGDYRFFEAEVGLQPCAGGGSVIFRVFVDARLAFESGVLRATNPPVPVQVIVAGASELRLEAADAGDGITCDMANWADARLTGSSELLKKENIVRVDAAAFASVTVSDPHRNDGSRANRIEEFRAEDIFLERVLAPERTGVYRLFPTNGLACVGLYWLNRRALTELRLRFGSDVGIPAIDSVQVQAWFGESAWQGTWRRLEGKVESAGNQLSFNIAATSGLIQTRKVRWVFPAQKPVLIEGLSAYTHSRWDTIQLLVQLEGSHSPGKTELRVLDGELISPSASSRDFAAAPKLHWNGASDLQVTVRYARASSLSSEASAIQFMTKRGGFAVAVQDVVKHGRVYLPDFGVSVSKYPLTNSRFEPSPLVPARSILQEVRAAPDQTLQQAWAKTHHQAQREGPVLLSLACDNLKFVLERDGTLRFPYSTNSPTDWLAGAGEIRPKFGNAGQGSLRRELEGGWLPVVLVSADDGEVIYRQRTFVAPADGDGVEPNRIGRSSACVMEFAITNTTASPADASVVLDWLINSRSNHVADVSQPGDEVVLDPAGLKAHISTEELGPLRLERKANRCAISGQLPPHGSASVALLVSSQGADWARSAGNVGDLRARAQRYWDAVLEKATQIQTPDPFLNDVIRSSQIRCLVDARNEAGGLRIAPWIAAMSYGPLESEAHSVIRGMDYLGHSEFARRGLDFFIHRYNTNGFLTTGYTTFGTAWHLWTLGEHHRLYRDSKWLAEVAPEIARVGDWIVRQTAKTAVGYPTPGPASPAARDDGRPPEFGLMPPGVLADWNAFAYHYAMNGYYYAALRELASALPDVPSRSMAARAKSFSRSAAELRANTLSAYRWTQSQSPALRLRNGSWIPHYPSQVHSPGPLAAFFPGQDAGRSWCYDVELGAHQLVPTGVLAPEDPEVTRMLDHMEDVQFLADGWFDYPGATNQQDWFNLGGFSKVQPYYTRNCEIYALRHDVKPFVRSYFNSLAAMLNPEVLTFWEHFNHSGAWDKTHETGYFLHQTRTMLLQEHGPELWLCPLVTSNWFGHGMSISVSNAPTRFGPMSYKIHSRVGEDGIVAHIRPPQRQLPERIVLWLRHPGLKPIETVLLNGRHHRGFDASLGRVTVRPSQRDSINIQVFY